ncbi:MAG: hypothetical protein ACR2GR_06225 [Rhodothermales bacterium]
MPTKPLLVGAAIFQGLYGVALLFLPDELLGLFALDVRGALFAQQFGTALLGLAAVNWIGRGTSVGGIYGRPLVLGNLAFFMTNALLLVRQVLERPEMWVLWVNEVIVAGFALVFALLLFGKIQTTKKNQP